MCVCSPLSDILHTRLPQFLQGRNGTKSRRKGKGKAKEAPNGAGDTPAQPEAVIQPEEGDEPRRDGIVCPSDDENDGPAAVQMDDCLDGPEAYPDLVSDSETDDDEVDESVAAPASSAAPAAAGTGPNTAGKKKSKKERVDEQWTDLREVVFGQGNNAGRHCAH